MKLFLIRLATPCSASMFQFYNTRCPYWESAQLLRKASLLLALVITKNPASQAAFAMALNISYLLLLVRSRPFVYFPSSLFRGHNLFHLCELSSVLVCLGGNVLAFIAATDLTNTDLANTMGIGFAIFNLSFAVLFLLSFNRELNALKRIPTRSEATNLGEAGDSEGEWLYMLQAIEAIQEQDSKKRKLLIDGLPFAYSSVLVGIEDSLWWDEAQWPYHDEEKGEVLRQKFRGYQDILERVNADFVRLSLEAAQGARMINDVKELIREQELNYCRRVITGAVQDSDGVWIEDRNDFGSFGRVGNPLGGGSTGGVDIELSTIAIKPYIARAESYKKEYKARAKSNSKSRSNEKPPPPPTTLVATMPQQNLLGGSAPPPPPAPPSPPPKPDLWIRATDASGNLYYIHRETNETVWKIP